MTQRFKCAEAGVGAVFISHIFRGMYYFGHHNGGPVLAKETQPKFWHSRWLEVWDGFTSILLHPADTLSGFKC